MGTGTTGYISNIIDKQSTRREHARRKTSVAGAALFGWSRSRFFGPAPAPTPTVM